MNLNPSTNRGLRFQFFKKEVGENDVPHSIPEDRGTPTRSRSLISQPGIVPNIFHMEQWFIILISDSQSLSIA